MTASPPLVSVYVTSHNYGRYIRQCLDSVLAQTMQDFELIVIDDGSTDGSPAIIETYVGDPRIVPVYQHNKGLTVTNNIALRMAQGEFIMRLDADDWLDPHALEIMSGVLRRKPDVGMVFPDYYIVGEGGEIEETVRRHDFDQVTLMDQPAHGACTMIRRQCLLDLGGYDETLRCQDGYDLWVRFIEHFRVENVNLPLFFYRQHGVSLTRNEERILTTRAEIIARHASLRDSGLTALAILPVRGRTGGRDSMSLRPLGDRALIDWSIDAALGAHYVKTLAVTTPDEEILEHVRRKYGERVVCVSRDPRLAAPNTYIEDTLLDALAAAADTANPPEAVVHLNEIAPFRTAEQIDTAVEVMCLFDTDVTVAVRADTDVFYQHDGGGLKLLRKTSRLRLEREELYRQVAGLRVIRRAFLETRKTTMAERTGHIVIDQRAAHLLRTDFDWKIAEFLAAELAHPQTMKRAST